MENIRDLIERFNDGVATPGECRKLKRMLQSGLYDDLVGEDLYKRILQYLDDFDSLAITPAEREAARPAFEQSRRLLQEYTRTFSAPAVPAAQEPPPQSHTWRWLAAAAVVAIITGAALILYVEKPVTPPAVATVVTAGQTYTGKQFIHLPDGSTVILNAGSELRYDSTFGRSSRDVVLSGEAFFEIQHDSNRPFRVWSGNVYTYVLGTAFNVKAYPDQDEIVVTVTRGKVKVCEDRRSLGVVMPHRQLTINRATLHAEQQADAAAALTWKDDFLILDNVTMAAAAEAIGRRFGVSVTVDEDVRDCHINAAFLNNESLAHILTVVSKVLHGAYSLQGSAVTISGSCH